MQDLQVIESTNSIVSISKEDQIKKLADSFLSGRAERTQLAYSQDLQDFATFLGTECLNNTCSFFIQQEHGTANSIALAYKAHLLERGLSPATINRRLSSLRSVVAFANTCGLVSWELNIKNERAEKYRDTSGISIPLFKKLIESVAKQRNQAKASRDLAILHLLYSLALRRNELRLLSYPQDIDLKNGHIFITGKGKREKQKLSLPLSAIQVLQEWIHIRGEWEGALFIQMSSAIKEPKRITNRGLTKLITSLGKKIGIDLSPHKIRHTAITQAVKTATANGIDLTEILQFSRHANVGTLMIYRDQDRDVQGTISNLVAESL